MKINIFLGVAEPTPPKYFTIYPQLIVELYSDKYNQRLIDVDSGPGYNGNSKKDISYSE